MMYLRLKNVLKSLWFLLLVFFSIHCREPVVPTEEDLAGYGWVLYESGEYQEAQFLVLMVQY